MFLYSVNCRASSDTPALWRPAADLAARFPHPTSDPPSHRPADAPPPPTPSRQHGRRLRTRGPHTATRNPPPRPPNGHAPRRCHTPATQPTPVGTVPTTRRAPTPATDLLLLRQDEDVGIFSGPVLLLVHGDILRRARDDVRNLGLRRLRCLRPANLRKRACRVNDSLKEGEACIRRARAERKSCGWVTAPARGRRRASGALDSGRKPRAASRARRERARRCRAPSRPSSSPTARRSRAAGRTARACCPVG